MQWQTNLPLIAILRGITPGEALAHVGAVIDAGDNHVGEVVEHAGDSKVYAVRRRAVDMVETVGRALQRERTIERQRIACTTAIPLGRHHRDLAKRAQGFGERRNTRGEITVVVADQDAHLKSVRVAEKSGWSPGC